MRVLSHHFDHQCDKALCYAVMALLTAVGVAAVWMAFSAIYSLRVLDGLFGM